MAGKCINKGKDAIIDELVARDKDHTIEELVDLIADKIDPAKMDELKAAMLEKNKKYLQQEQQEQSSDSLIQDLDNPEDQEISINNEILENEGADGTDGPLIGEDLRVINQERIADIKLGHDYKTDKAFAEEVDRLEEQWNRGELGVNRLEEGLNDVEACQRRTNGDLL